MGGFLPGEWGVNGVIHPEWQDRLFETALRDRAKRGP